MSYTILSKVHYCSAMRLLRFAVVLEVLRASGNMGAWVSVQVHVMLLNSCGRVSRFVASHVIGGKLSFWTNIAHWHIRPVQPCIAVRKAQ